MDGISLLRDKIKIQIEGDRVFVVEKSQHLLNTNQFKLSRRMKEISFEELRQIFEHKHVDIVREII